MLEEVHVTGLREFLRCRRKWMYGHERKLQPLGGYHSDQMGTGSAFHAGMRSIYADIEKGRAIGAVELERAVEALEETVRSEGGDPILAEDMVRYYWQEFGSKEKLDEIVQVELPVEYTYKNYRLRGTMDLVYRLGDRLVVRDYKTVESVTQDPNYIRLDFQFQVYAFLLWHHYRQPVEFEVVKVRRQVPPGFGSRPVRRNKDGSVSRNNASLDPSDYVQHIPWPYNEIQLLQFERRLQGVLDSITNEREAQLWPRTDIPYGVGSCTSCPFFDLCGTELMEGDLSDDDISTAYEHTTPRL